MIVPFAIPIYNSDFAVLSKLIKVLALYLIFAISFSGITIIIVLFNRLSTETAESASSAGVDLITIDVRFFSESIKVLFNSLSADDN